jgi:GH15 family glucan-1,4-alpha-glucosidase
VPQSNVSSVRWPFCRLRANFCREWRIVAGQHWQLLRRTANYTCAHWHLPESGIWELSVEAHYVAGKVMSWVVLERAAQISQLTKLGRVRPAWSGRPGCILLH